MAFSSKSDAVSNMNSNITSPTQPHLTPTGGDNKVRASNLKQWINDFLDWITPVSVVDLKRKSPVVTGTGTNYASISWVEILPVGSIIPWAGASTTPPDGYLFCDGNLKSTATYPDLSAVLGTNYNGGSVPVGQFRVPNLEEKVPIGFKQTSPTTPTSSPSTGQTNYGKVGNIGGVASATLLTSNLPVHNHDKGSLSTISNGEHRHTIIGEQASGVGDGNDDDIVLHNGGKSGWVQYSMPGNTSREPIQPSGSHTHTISGNTGNSGSGTAHENRMPYIVLKYIIKF